MANIVMTCILIHNLIVESRRCSYESGIALLSESIEGRELVNGGVFQWINSSVPMLHPDDAPPGSWAAWICQHEKSVQDAVDHALLQKDLIEHIWRRQGDV